MYAMILIIRWLEASREKREGGRMAYREKRKCMKGVKVQTWVFE